MSTALPSSSIVWSDPIEEAISRTLILALINRYAAIAREITDSNLVKELFEPDSVIEFPDGRQLAPSQLDQITNNFPPALLRHHLTTIDVQFISETEAHCQSYIIAGSHLRIPDHWGRWDDVVKKQSDGRWKFSKKVVVVDGMNPEGWLAKVLSQNAS
jgi:hypothetical protein